MTSYVGSVPPEASVPEGQATCASAPWLETESEAARRAATVVVRASVMPGRHDTRSGASARGRRLRSRARPASSGVADAESRRIALALALAIPAAAAGGWGLRGVLWAGGGESHRGPVGSTTTGRASPPPPAVAPLPLPAHLRALLVGGGPHPSANEVQLEDDLALARDVLGSEGTVLLFSGGPGTRAVRIEAGSPSPPTLRDRVAELFSTGSSRGSTFRATELEVHGASTLSASLELLALARADTGGPPLLFYFAGHGEGGDAPEDATALFWGGEALDPMTLADELDAARPTDGATSEADLDEGEGRDDDGRADEAGGAVLGPGAAPRRLRIVMTSCFSGGFADLVFAGADPARGPSPDDRCGLFATAWDREASGCDADPDRARHEGYGVHFLHALAGRARDGSDARASIDLDGDGTITLSEAHARARIASRSIDVPTSTSARLVRELAAGLRAPDAPAVSWPEEEAVRRALGEALDVASVVEAERRESDAEARSVELDASREEAEDAEGAAWLELTRSLLSSWPTLDDPWHADFERTLADEGDAIEAALDRAPAYAAWLEATAALSALDADTEALALELALLRRYLEADETLALAATLAAAQPEAWQIVLRVRACEGSAP